MAIYKIKKRNGAITTFDRKKIEDAIRKAVIAAEWNDFTKIGSITDKIIELIEIRTWKNIPEIELIQDCIEETLIKLWHNTTVKKFIIYRRKREEARKSDWVVVEVWDTMQEYLKQSDWRVNENANQWYSLWWLILNISWKIVANYWLSHVYPEEIWNVHRNGDMHIHDLGMFSWYCAGWSLRQLLEEWFNWLPNRIQSAPPKNLQAAVNQMINFFGTLQNEWAWAQAFSSFDTYLAPFIHKYKKSLTKELEETWSTFQNDKERQQYIDDRTYKYVKQQMQNFIFWLNVPSRWWTQTPFTNITIDRVCPNDLKDKSLLLGWIENWYYEKKFWELEDEMRLLNKVLIDVYTEWDMNGTVFTFPIPTYNITEDFPWNDPLIDDLFEMTAKYWIPYFQNFVGSQFEKDENWKITDKRRVWAYEPWAVRSMCCRLQLDLKQLEKRWWWLFWSAEMTWSIWVVTLNLWRIWYNYKWDLEWYKNRVKYLMDLAKTSLELKRKEITKRLDAGFYPYTKRYLHSFRNHFSTIWINWMNESILNFTEGKENISTEKWKEIAIEIMDYMREVLIWYQEETDNLYNLEATPAEGTTYRFAKEDKKQLKWIIQAWTDEAPYYTNSSQLPVWFTDDAFESLSLQDELQCKYTWWTVLHLYMWERVTDAKACKELVKKAISNYQLPYISITPTFSLCPKHWYISGEHDYCPKCDQELWYTWKEFNIETRTKYTDDLEKLDEISKKTI